MTEADLEQIEKDLGIALPSDYRAIVLHFPVRFEAGTTSGFLWDEPTALIERNLEYRTTRNSWGVELKPLPSQYFFIGDDKAGWQNLIDTTSEPSMVYTMEYDNIERISPTLDREQVHQSLSQWFHAYLEDYRDGGVDISAETYPQNEPTWGCILIVLAFCVFMAFIFVLITIGLETLLEMY